MKHLLPNLSVKTACVVLAFACVIGHVLPNTAARGDTVRLNKQSVIGEVKQMTPESITFVRGSSETQIPSYKIVAISFSDEPKQLIQAREAVVSGRFEDAVKALKELDTSSLKGNIAADATFYEAAAAAELALRGRSPINEAGSKLNQFIKTYPNSFHYYRANRLLGDLLVAAGQPGSAVAYYEKLTKAPWPEYQIDAKIVTASAILAAGKTSEAQPLLSQVTTSGTLSPAQVEKVKLLKAQSLINDNKPDEAITLIEKIIKTTSPESIDINAQAYNMLGRAYRRASRPQDALLAFLHVDLLYPGNAVEHADALGNLAELWTQTHKPDRARLATETLKQRYPFSRWNK